MARFTLNLNGPLLKVPDSISSASFDYVSRYQIIGEIVERYYRSNKKPQKILDVGGLGSILDQLTRIPVVILDNEVTDESANKTLGDGANMHSIPDGSFEVVVTSDTLEHIPLRDRSSFIKELVRVSSDLVIICSPFGDYGAAKQEAELQKFYRKLTGQEHRWLKEHSDYGLPMEKIILGYLPKDVNHVVVRHSNIFLWKDMLQANLLANEVKNESVFKSVEEINRLYNKDFLFRDFSGESYRSFIVISKSRNIVFTQPQYSVTKELEALLYRHLHEFYNEIVNNAIYLPEVVKISQRLTLSEQKNSELITKNKLLATQLDNMLTSKTWRYSEILRKAYRYTRGINNER